MTIDTPGTAGHGGIHLVSMPWHALALAPITLAVPREILARSHPDIQVTEHFGNLAWAEYVLAGTGGRLLPGDYHDIADNGIELGLGDWVFAGSLYGDPAWRADELRRFAARRGAGDLAAVYKMRELADGFIEAMASQIAAAAPLLVGFTTTFMQNVPSLALARRLKEKAPGTVIVFGGANCDGPMGAALHRNHRFVDYVVRGEAELVLPELMDVILSGSGAAGLDGVCWWSGPDAVANPQLKPVVPVSAIPAVSYDAWHDALARSPLREYVQPWLVVEGSRGCWWGERHQCTFCGLNGPAIGFRAKPAGRLWEEISRLVQRYKILDVVTSDNIMSVEYFRDLLPLMTASGWDMRVHFEMKANVTEEQIAQLAQAGVVLVQFGIESFSTRVLRLMDKGIDGATAVRVLRDSANYGVSALWNYLYGFPGELDADYESVIAQLPALVHLQPPLAPRASRIALERFSPYFDRPELGFVQRAPAGMYAHVYDLPEDELRDLAYFFDCPDRGITGELADALDDALAHWSKAFPTSSLCMQDRGDVCVIEDRREGWAHGSVELTGWRRAAYLALRSPRRPPAVLRRLAEAGVPGEESGLDRWLAQMRDRGLVFCDDGRWVALATDRAHAKLAVT